MLEIASRTGERPDIARLEGEAAFFSTLQRRKLQETNADGSPGQATRRLRDVIESVLGTATTTNSEEVGERIAQLAAQGADMAAADASGTVGLLQLAAMHVDPALYDAMLRAIPESQRAPVLNARWDGGNTVMHALAFRHPDRYEQARAYGGDSTIKNDGGYSADAIEAQHKKRILPLITAGSVAAAAGAGVALVSAGIIVGLGAVAYALFQRYGGRGGGSPEGDFRQPPTIPTPMPTRPTTSPFEGLPTPTPTPPTGGGPAVDPASDRNENALLRQATETLTHIFDDLDGPDQYRFYRDIAALELTHPLLHTVLRMPGSLQRRYDALLSQVRYANLEWDSLYDNASSWNMPVDSGIITALAPLAPFVTPWRRSLLINHVLSEGSEENRRDLLASPIPLTDEQFERFLDDDPAEAGTEALGALGARMDRMSEAQRDAWVDAVLASDSVGGALENTGGGLRHLSEAQQARLVDAAMAMLDSFEGQQDLDPFLGLLYDFARHQADFRPSQRVRIAGMVDRVVTYLSSGNAPDDLADLRLSVPAMLRALTADSLEEGRQRQAIEDILALEEDEGRAFALTLIVRSWGQDDSLGLDERPEDERHPAHHHDEDSTLARVVDHLLAETERQMALDPAEQDDAHEYPERLAALAGWASHLDESQINRILDVTAELGPTERLEVLEAFTPHLSALDRRPRIHGHQHGPHARDSMTSRIVDGMLGLQEPVMVMHAIVLLRAGGVEHLDEGQLRRMVGLERAIHPAGELDAAQRRDLSGPDADTARGLTASLAEAMASETDVAAEKLPPLSDPAFAAVFQQAIEHELADQDPTQGAGAGSRRRLVDAVNDVLGGFVDQLGGSFGDKAAGLKAQELFRTYAKGEGAGDIETIANGAWANHLERIGMEEEISNLGLSQFVGYRPVGSIEEYQALLSGDEGTKTFYSSDEEFPDIIRFHQEKDGEIVNAGVIDREAAPQAAGRAMYERDLQDRIQRGDIGFRELFEMRFRDGSGRPDWSDALTRTVDEHLRSEQPSTEDMEALRVDILGFSSKWTRRELQDVLDSGIAEGKGLGLLKETITALFYENDFRNMPSDQQYDDALDALVGYIAEPMKSQRFLPELDDSAKGYLADVIKYHLFHLEPRGGDRQQSALAVRYHHGNDYLVKDIPGIVADRLKEIFGKGGKGGKGAGEVVEDWFEDQGSDAHEAMKELITREYDGYVAYANWHYGGPDSPALRMWER